MIHLDHSSQPSLLAWPSLTDPPPSLDAFLPFQPDIQIPSITDPTTTSAAPILTSATSSTNNQSRPQPVIPVLDEHTDPTSNPGLTLHTVAPLSPHPPDVAADRSSSLSPVPDSGSPAPLPPHTTTATTITSADTATDLTARPLPPLAQEEEEQQPQFVQKEEEEDAMPGPPSNQSTPLSELSPPPDHDSQDALNTEQQPTLSGTASAAKAPVSQAKPAQSTLEPASSNVAVDSLAESSTAQHLINPTNTDLPSSSDRLHDSTSDQRSSQPNLDSSPLSVPPVNSHSPITRITSFSELTTATPSQPLFLAQPPTLLGDSKVVAILELNAELLKVSMEFQARGIPMNEPKFQQISVRLQSNLAWLAAAADQSRQGSHSNMPLPVMECPSFDSMPMERIQKLYADLPAIFSKEIARRLQLGMSINTAPILSVNQNLKRDRSDEALDPMSKRRDTGEGKFMTSSIPPPAIPSLSIPTPSSVTQTNYPLPMPNGNATTGMQPPSLPTTNPVSNTSMVIPRITGGVQLNTTEAQAAASSRDRARQMQIRQAMHQHQQMQASGSRQMSPLSGPTGTASSIQQQQHSNPQMPVQAHQNTFSSSLPVPGPSMNTANSTSNPNTAATPGALGPNAAQNFQLLQNASHPFVQYMLNVVPGFATLPIPQQLQKMQAVQAALQARNQPQNLQSSVQQQRSATFGNAAGPSAGAGIAMQNNHGGAGNNSGTQFTHQNQAGGGGPPSSPASHHSPVMLGQQLSQQQQQQHQPSTTGLANPHAMAQAGMGLAGLTVQQQRQFLLQQQQQQHHHQQMLRAGASGVGVGQAGMMGTQQGFSVSQEQRLRQEQHNQQLQQRMAQAGSPPGHGMMLEDGFMGLHSNGVNGGRTNAIPGIARSTRSPSETISSPMTPRRAGSIGLGGGGVGVGIGGTQDEYQRMMHAQQQAQALAMRNMPTHSPASFGGQVPLPGSMPGVSSASPPNWQQQQHNHHQQQQQQQQQAQQQAMQMGVVGNGGGQSLSFGMSPPTQSGHGAGSFAGSPSPSNSQVWQSHYPFSPSPNAVGMVMPDRVHTPRHLSETPAPSQQQQSQSQSLQNNSPSMETSLSADFDIFNWNGQ